jgi:RNA polymerase sigma-B factor
MDGIPTRVLPADRREVAEFYRTNLQRYRQLTARFSFLRDETARAREGMRLRLGQCRAHRQPGACACVDRREAPRLSMGGRGFTHQKSPPPTDQRTEELLALHRAYADGDATIREQLVVAYDDFARALARDFHTRRESLEDLTQVARLGLLQAIDRFDPSLGRPFVVFARATITGELKRHVRDRTWSMRVPRSLQEHYLAVVRAVDELTQDLGRSPLIQEVAERTGLSGDHVIEAMELGSAQRLASLDAPLPDGKALEPGIEDIAFEAAESRAFLANVLSRLPEREQRILELRFREGLTQTEIGTRLGVSQMHVSRLLSRTLTRLRGCAQSN